MKVKHYWDTQDQNSVGWYVEVQTDKGEYIIDSAKIWFPVNVDDYNQDQEKEMLVAVHSAMKCPKNNLVFQIS